MQILCMLSCLLLIRYSPCYTVIDSGQITGHSKQSSLSAKFTYYANLLCPCPAQCNWCQVPGISLGSFYQPQSTVNPCSNGKPSPTISGTLLICSKSLDSTVRCPIDHYCHIGVTAETTACCPRTKDIELCSLPLVRGRGATVTLRFYYQTESCTCQPFWYRGIAGNENNFISKEECELTCKRTPPEIVVLPLPPYPQPPTPPQPVAPVNPCSYGRPLTAQNGLYFVCTSLPNNSDNCGANYWCHLGASQETTVCCPGGVETDKICTLPSVTGMGNESLARWFYDSYSRQCTAFRYNGLQGNQNNFLSEELCQAKCEATENACGQGTTLRNQYEKGAPLHCDSGTCPNGAWCHYGAPQERPLCCSDASPNPCQLRLAPGDGRFSLQRWYFKAYSKQCELFMYSGRGGNQNNFLSQSDCYKTCLGTPVTLPPLPPILPPPNPCKTGYPALDSATKPIKCAFRSGCGRDFWCHIGGSEDGTACCPGALDVACTGILPEQGTGSFQLTRWFYDSIAKQCKHFTYNGLQGNQNNFLSKEDCESTCLVQQAENPCVYTPPIPSGCSILNPICPGNQWCHIGATSSSTTCCDKAAPNICTEPLAVGIGNAALTRHFYNMTSKKCEFFTYSGLKGNQNNFLTLEECETKCKTEPDSNVCPLGQPLLTRSGAPLTCDQYLVSATCPLGFWCHIGTPEEEFSTVCCPKTTENVCSLPPSPGRGDRKLSRYFYDQKAKRCASFEYFGAKGNENNFESLELCEMACGEYTNPCTGQPATALSNQTVFCSPANKDVCPVNFWCHVGATPQSTVCCPGATLACTVPLAPGTGTSRLKRFYYNADKKICEQFEYFGLGGNQNNFETLDECESVCPAELCALSIDWGTPCHEPPSIRYAYDRTSKSCVAFTFNGCGGNLNSFSSMQECSAVCSNTAYRRRKRRQT